MTVWPRRRGSRRVGGTVLASVMVSPGGRCRRWSLAWRSIYSERAAPRTASSRKNMKGLLHVAVGGGCCLLRTAAVLTRAQVGRVPVPPVVLGVRLLVSVVVLRRLAEELCKGCDVHGSSSRQLPLASGKPSRDLLEQPTVPVRFLERGKREIGTTLTVAPADAWVLHGVVEGT